MVLHLLPYCKPSNMKPLIFLCCTVIFLACNNQSTESETLNADSSNNRSATPSTLLSEESELEIMAGCVDNAKPNLGEAKAYALCKCVLEQIQEKFPGADSSALIGYLNDTTQVRQMAEECK